MQVGRGFFRERGREGGEEVESELQERKGQIVSEAKRAVIEGRGKEGKDESARMHKEHSSLSGTLRTGTALPPTHTIICRVVARDE